MWMWSLSFSKSLIVLTLVVMMGDAEMPLCWQGVSSMLEALWSRVRLLLIWYVRRRTMCFWTGVDHGRLKLWKGKLWVAGMATVPVSKSFPLVSVLAWGATGVRLPSVGLQLNASNSESFPGSRIQQHSKALGWPPIVGPLPASLLEQGSGGETPSSQETEHSRKGGCPLAHNTKHICGEPGVKLFDDLLLGQECVP